MDMRKNKTKRVLRLVKELDKIDPYIGQWAKAKGESGLKRKDILAELRILCQKSGRE